MCRLCGKGYPPDALYYSIGGQEFQSFIACQNRLLLVTVPQLARRDPSVHVAAEYNPLLRHQRAKQLWVHAVKPLGIADRSWCGDV